MERERGQITIWLAISLFCSVPDGFVTSCFSRHSGCDREGKMAFCSRCSLNVHAVSGHKEEALLLITKHIQQEGF